MSEENQNVPSDQPSTISGEQISVNPEVDVNQELLFQTPVTLNSNVCIQFKFLLFFIGI